MNDSLRRLAAETPIPVLEDGSPARTAIRVERTGPDHRPTEPCGHSIVFRVVFGLDYGLRDSEPVGPVFARPRDAAAFCRLLEGSAE